MSVSFVEFVYLGEGWFGVILFLPFSFVAVMLLYTCFSIYVHMYSAKVVTGRVPFPLLNGLCVQDSAHKIAYVCVLVSSQY